MLRPTFPALFAALAATSLVAAGCGSGGGAKTIATTAGKPAKSARTAAKTPAAWKVTVHQAGHLPAPVQLPATTAAPGGTGGFLLGGLDSADASSAAIVRFGTSGAHQVGTLPAALHDAAAATVGGHVYFFGGGNAGAGAPEILKITNGKAASAGKLPVGASDVEAATIGDTAYIVGGYTGTVPLRSIFSFRPGTGIKVAAEMPRPLRYAAVAAVGRRLLVAGGTSGTTARREILRFDPQTGKVTTIGKLPQAITHAAGASLGGTFYVIGGRGLSLTSQHATIYAVDPATGRVRVAGRLPTALSDIGAATTPKRALVVGGRDATGKVHDGILAMELKR